MVFTTFVKPVGITGANIEKYPTITKKQFHVEFGLEMANNTPYGKFLMVLKMQNETAPLSYKLGLDFPYDWSNPGMSEDIFIHNVLKKGRFLDVLRLVRHYGLDRIETVAQELVEAPHWPRLSQVLDRIRVGKARSLSGS